jgi:hypothetical protein
MNPYKVSLANWRPANATRNLGLVWPGLLATAPPRRRAMLCCAAPRFLTTRHDTPRCIPSPSSSPRIVFAAADTSLLSLRVCLLLFSCCPSTRRPSSRRTDRADRRVSPRHLHALAGLDAVRFGEPLFGVPLFSLVFCFFFVSSSFLFSHSPLLLLLLPFFFFFTLPLCSDMAPHIYTIADDSYNALVDYNLSQSIVIR